MLNLIESKLLPTRLQEVGLDIVTGSAAILEENYGQYRPYKPIAPQLRLCINKEAYFSNRRRA